MNARHVAVVLLVLIVTIACTGTDPMSPGDDAVRLTKTHTLGEPVVVGNLTVWPVFTDDPVDLGEFRTLSEALAGGMAEVREVGGEGGQQRAQSLDLPPSGEMIEEGSDEPRMTARIVEFDEEIPDVDIPRVNVTSGQTATITNSNDLPELIQDLDGGGATVGTLVIENKGDLPLLVCAGTIVKGGNQDRQIGEDIIIEAHTKVPVEAFCVEQGRWTAQRMGEVTNGQFEVGKVYALKPIRLKGQYLKQQGEVWEEVAETKAQWRKAFQSVEMSTTPRTQNARIVDETTSLAVVLDANQEVSGEEIEAIRKQVRAHFANFGDAVGFAYAVDGKVVTVRAFLNDAVFAKQFDPFLTSMVTEAWIAAQGKKDAPAVAGKAEDVVALVADLENASEKTAQTRGSNLNGLKMNESGYNGNCYLPVKGKNVAVTRDWTSK